jgi:hypothetical protein
MLGTRSAWMLRSGEPAGRALILEPAGTALWTRREAARSGLGTAVEDWFAALDAWTCGIGSGSRGSRWRWWWRSLVDRTRPGLGHDHLAHLGSRSGRRCFHRCGSFLYRRNHRGTIAGGCRGSHGCWRFGSGGGSWFYYCRSYRGWRADRLRNLRRFDWGGGHWLGSDNNGRGGLYLRRGRGRNGGARRRRDRRLDHHCYRRSYRNGRTDHGGSRGLSPNRPGDDRACWRASADGRSWGRNMHDWRRLTGLRDNLARLRPLLRRCGGNDTRRRGNGGTNSARSR